MPKELGINGASVSRLSSGKVTVLNVAHPRWDPRIWVKETSALRDAGILAAYEVADGLGSELRDGVEIIDHGARRGRGFWPRVWHVARIARLTRARRGDVVHFHDPMFLPGALWLKLRGRRIVYDVHEDYPRQVLNWELPFCIRYGMSLVYRLLEWMGGALFDGVVAATPTIARRFPVRKTTIIYNFPVIGELFSTGSRPYTDRSPVIAYVGGIARIRGAFEMVEAVGMLAERTGVQLKMAGTFSPTSLSQELRDTPGWGRCEYLGWLCREEIAAVLGEARVGLVILYPESNFIDAYPVKLFEYMAAGLPVIASNLPLLREIVEGADCGLTVDPHDPEDIARAIGHILDRADEAQSMGERGRRAVIEKYNWGDQREKLIQFYREKIGLRC